MPELTNARRRRPFTISIDSLPPEILGAVFEQGLEPYTLSDLLLTYYRRTWLRGVCLVSRRWNQIAYSLPKLWSVIVVEYRVYGPGYEPSYQECRAHLSRVKSYPIDVWLKIDVGGLPSPDRQEFWAIWREVTQRSDQWRSIKIGRIPILDPREHFRLPALLPASLPNLLEAKFDLITGPVTPYASAPRLRELHLKNDHKMPFVPFISMNNLETVCITGCLQGTQNLLQQSSNLRTLRWSVTTRQDDINDLDLPTLTSIEFTPRPAFYFVPLRNLLTALRQTAMLTIKLSRPTLYELPTAQSVEQAGEIIRWMEEHVVRVVWIDGENERVLSSELWQKAREKFGAKVYTGSELS